MPFDNRLPTYESLLEFQEVYLRAIALSWENETFKENLIKDANQALKNYFGYTCPWNINIAVEEPKQTVNCHWDKAQRKWVNLPRNSITFGIPFKPDHGDEAIALAAYNDAGPSYLFTCC